MTAGSTRRVASSSSRRLPPPRWQTPLPPGVVGSWGPDVAAFAELELRISLDRWQRRALNRALAIDETGRLVHGMYLVSTARQNGKTAVVRALIGWALTARSSPDWRRILGLAHDKKQARIPYKAVRADLVPMSKRLGRAGGLHLTTYLGIRSELHGRHREYEIASRESSDNERGESNDLVVFDEVRTQRDFDTWAAIEPTTTARPDPLILPISTAGNDRSVLLRTWWERGLAIIDGAEPAGRFGMTWYAAPDGLSPDDPRAWRAANPSLAEGRLRESVLRESYLANLRQPQVFREERLNLWSDAVDAWLPVGVWPTLVAPQPDGFARVVLGIEAAPTWGRASIVAAIATDSGGWVGIVSDIRPTSGATVDPRELVAELGRVAGLWRPAGIAYSATAAAAPHLAAWAAGADVPAAALTPRDIRSASELFRAELVGGRLTHRDDPLLAYQVRAVRPSGAIEAGDWYLSVRESAGYVDAIRACAWASWALLAPATETPLQAFL